MKLKLFLSLFLFILAHYVIFSVALSDVSGSPIAAITSNYFMHFLTFFGLSFLFSLILVISEKYIKYPFTISFLYSVFIAVLVEMLQISTTKTRFFSYLDILAGTLGASVYSILGIVAYNFHLFEKYWK
ncbi:MAG: VanZ family protein [Candidatus Woesearchaeota archaeon]